MPTKMVTCFLSLTAWNSRYSGTQWLALHDDQSSSTHLSISPLIPHHDTLWTDSVSLRCHIHVLQSPIYTATCFLLVNGAIRLIRRYACVMSKIKFFTLPLSSDSGSRKSNHLTQPSLAKLKKSTGIYCNTSSFLLSNSLPGMHIGVPEFALNDGTKLPAVGLGWVIDLLCHWWSLSSFNAAFLRCWMGDFGGGQRVNDMCEKALKVVRRILCGLLLTP
jgi:hypothetical protein